MYLTVSLTRTLRRWTSKSKRNLLGPRKGSRGHTQRELLERATGGAIHRVWRKVRGIFRNSNGPGG